MKDDWIDLGEIGEFPDGSAVLKKHDGHRFACVRRGGDVHALDDRCPHQGYPLSQGTIADGVLTCAWHNWKFDTATGDCTFGGEPVRRYPVRVEGGRVHLNRAVDAEREAARLEAGVLTAFRDDDTSRTLREALRLGAFRGGPAALGALGAGFALVAGDGARRAEYGFDHGLAVTADLVAWASRGWVGAEEAFVQAAHAIAEPSRRLGARAVPSLDGVDAPRDPTAVAGALLAERRAEAEARTRAIAEVDGVDAAVRALLPFAATHVLDYGHGAIFLSKARELATAFPEARAALLGASTLELAWATADTALPPFAATRAALERVDVMGDRAERDVAFDRPAFEREILVGERSAVAAAVARLGEGVAPEALLRAIGHAAAVRLFRFDGAWEQRVDADVGVLDVTHAVTFTEAALALCPLATSRDRARFAVLAAGFVGKVRRGDAEAGGPVPTRGDGLSGALARRDVGAALAAVRGLDAKGRAEAYREAAPFCALDAAVRPIFYAHTVKNAEALRRLDAADPEADGAYLDALLGFVTPVHVETRPRRTAFVAKKFLADGRPPEGLY